MKKVVLPLLISILFLASCGGGAPSASSEAPFSKEESSALSSHSSDVQVNLAQRFAEDRAKLSASENFTATYTYELIGDQEYTYGIHSQYGKNVLYWTDGTGRDDSYGIVKNGQYGVFDFALDATGNPVLGDFETFPGELTLGTLFESPVTLTSDQGWKLTTDKKGYRNSNLTEVMSELTGIADLASYNGLDLAYDAPAATYENGNLVISIDGYLGNDHVITGKMTVTDIDATHDTKIEAFASSEHVPTARTGWTSQDLISIRTYFGGSAAENLPFPTGASYAFYVEPMLQYKETMIVDLASGDISASYIAQLTAAGFSATDLGTYTLCTKTKTTANAKYTYNAAVSFTSVSEIASSWGQEYVPYYPNGRFQIEVYCEKEATSPTTNGVTGSLSDVESWMDSRIPLAFPKTGWTNVNSAEILDRTDYWNGLWASSGIFYTFVAKATYYVATDAEATANVEAYVSLLEAQGYEKQEDDFIYYRKGKGGITIYVNRDTNGNYGGYIMIMYEVFE